MWPLLRSLTAPLISLILLILGYGLCNTFISLRLELDGYPTRTIGYMTSSLYIGIFFASFWIDRLISKLGMNRFFIGCNGCIAALILIQSLWIDPYFWSLLRFFAGICTAGIFIVIEAWILVQATPSQRGTILSIYLALFYGALSLGQLLIHIADPRTNISFWIIAFLSALSTIPLIMTKQTAPKIENPTRLKTIDLFKISPLGFLGVLISGIVLAAVYGLVPVYAKEIGLSNSDIGNLMALLIFGGLCFQWPLGKVSDLGYRRKVLLTACMMSALCSFAIAFTNNITLLFIWIFLFGGFSFTIYPLSMAHSCEKVDNSQLVSATSGFVLCYGVGAIIGPLLAPLAMETLGTSGLFLFLATISFIPALASFFKQRAKDQSW